MALQQKRNKKTFPTDAELLADFYEELIDEVLAEAAEWKNVTRQEAVELATIVHAVRLARIQRYGKDDPRTVISLPPTIEALLIECAEDGVLKGQGKGRPTGRRPDSRAIQIRKYAAKEAIAEWARTHRDQLDRQRKDQIVQQLVRNKKIQPAGVEDTTTKQAAKEASDWGYQHYGVRYAASTIEKWIPDPELKSRLIPGDF